MSSNKTMRNNMNEKSNLNRLDELQRVIEKKKFDAHMDGDSVTISKDELSEIEQALNEFQYVSRNLHLNENVLKDNQFGGLVQVIKDIKSRGY